MKFVSPIWCVVLLGIANVSNASDWPMWRNDISRSGYTPHAVGGALELEWSRDLGANHVAWGEDERIQFDASYEPIVLGTNIIIASARNHSVTAFNAESGELAWRVFVDAPVRLAPVGRDERVYFGADDGRVYCLDSTTGSIVWKLDAAPTHRMVLGNERLISVWPIRGGMVIDGDRLLFTAGVWPFEGTFLCSIDLLQEEPQIDRTMLDELSPQGHLAISGANLLIPCGRANVSVFDLNSMDPISVSYKSRGKTDFHVTADGRRIFHGDSVLNSEDRSVAPFTVNRPVSDGKRVYGTIETVIEDTKEIISSLAAFDVAHPQELETFDRKGEPVKKISIPQLWVLESDEIVENDQGPPRLYLKAGDYLYGKRGKTAFAANVSDDGPAIEWRHQFKSEPSSMLAAAGRLFVVTQNGQVNCFSPPTAAGQQSRSDPPRQFEVNVDPDPPKTESQSSSPAVAAAKEADTGYCVSVGIGDESVLDQILSQTNMHVIVIDDQADRVDVLRRRWNDRGLYGIRAFCIHSKVDFESLPPYMASLLIVNDTGQSEESKRFAADAFRILRPYGGKAIFAADSQTADNLADTAKRLAGATFEAHDGLVILSRPGALPGAANWTHEYGDSGNTLMSQDELVRAPFGVLWFGGPASDGELYFNRHYWGPGLTVVDGRMFVQGPQRLAAIDIYTGQILWKKTVRTGSGPGRRGNFFEVEKPGFHFTAAADANYLVYPDKCIVLDPKSGEETNTLRLKEELDQWGKVRVWKDLLIVSVFQDFPDLGLIPRSIAAVNRYTGETQWTKEADLTVPLIAVGSDTVYAFDGYLQDFYDSWKRRGLIPKSEGARSLRAIDARTGQTNWERPIEPIATWLAFSEDYNTLIVSNKAGVTAYRGDNGNEQWTKNEEAPGFGGHPENVWDKVIISGDQIIDQRGPGRAFSIETGEEILHRDPFTGQMVPWQFTKTGHHCNYAIASPHLLTFRAGTAGFFDRSSYSSGRLPGFRSGCRNSLIPAGGVLNAPNYAHGCVCSYNLFTSLALVHRPDASMWTYNAIPSPEKQIQRLGINLGAPGDRLADDGTMWIEYPTTDEPSASVPVELIGDQIEHFRLHPGEVEGTDEKWIVSCGVSGVAQMKVTIPRMSATESATYSVKLYFLEPGESVNRGDRVFNVSLQGETVLENFDIIAESNGTHRPLIKEFLDVPIGQTLLIEFQSKNQSALVCGVEISLASKSLDE